MNRKQNVQVSDPPPKVGAQHNDVAKSKDVGNKKEE